jgi:parvulin-like peptidyl-prolyl isomerase
MRHRALGRSACLPLVLLVLAACAAPRPPDPVVLALGEQELRRSDFERHVKAIEARGDAVTPAVREALFDRFLEEKVLVLEARDRGLIALGSSSEDEAVGVRKLIAAAIHPLAATDQEQADYYRDHAERFRVQDSVTLRQILVPTENEAREMRRRLQKEPKSFEVLARTASRAPEAAAGGLMGTFSPGQLPQEIEAAAFSLTPGVVSDIVQSPFGYHLFRVDARETGRQRTFDESREEIRGLLARERSEHAVQQFVQSLMARAKVNHEAAQAPRHDS